MAVFDAHHPWLLVFGVLGNIVSICVYFSPLPTFMKICRSKSTLGFQSLPYVVALFSAMLWMYYASLKTDAILLISINTFGCIIETIYIVIFLAYASTEARKHTVKLVSSLNVGLFSAIFLLTLFCDDGLHRVTVVGWICVAVSVCVFAAPLSIVYEVVRTRSVEFMPITLSFSLTLTAIMWFAYGLLLKDLCVALPNVLGFFLGVLQMLVYGMYRNAKEVVEMEKKLPEQIINIVMIGNSEVYPVDGKTDKDEKEKEEEREDEKCVGAVVHEPCTQMNVNLDSPVLIVCTA